MYKLTDVNSQLQIDVIKRMCLWAEKFSNYNPMNIKLRR